MAASANWRAILEAIKLIGLTENVEILKKHEKQRNSVILMLTSANSRFRYFNLNSSLSDFFEA